MSVLNQSGEEQVECPLCMEPLEVDDLNFFPCTCGYQICRFCWHRIRTDENGLCPACRKAYSENPADFTPLSKEQVAQLKAEKRQRDQQRKAKLTENRKHLASVRVVQKNLVFVVGLPMRLADPEILKRHEYFGKFGKIHKVVINQSPSYAGSQGPSASAYVTYMKSDDALRAIQSVNNITIDGRLIKSSLGTTKYCSHFMKNMPCPKPDCMYLHDFGDPEASFTKEQMHAGKHQEYEKKLHEALLNKTTTTTAPVDVKLTVKTKPEVLQQQKEKENIVTTTTTTVATTNNKDSWPQLEKDKAIEIKKSEIKTKTKSKVKNITNNNVSKKIGKNNCERNCQNETSELEKIEEKSSPPPSSSSSSDEIEIQQQQQQQQSSPAVTTTKINIIDDNSSFFSQNTFHKLTLKEDEIQSSSDSSPNPTILSESLPDINSTEDWEAAFGFTKHSNHLEELAKQRNSSILDALTAKGSFAPYKQENSPTEDRLQAQYFGGVSNGLKLFTDFYKNGYSEQNNYLAMQQRRQQLEEYLNVRQSGYGSHFLLQQQQQQQNCVNSSQFLNFDEVYQTKNNGRMHAEDELDFDPFQETQKGLAELLENEQNHKMHSNSTGRPDVGPTNLSQVNGMVHNNQLPPPPPGFMQPSPHMNSFGSKILPYLNMGNSNQSATLPQQQQHNGWPNGYSSTLQQQQQQHKGLGTCNDWKILDPAIVSSSRHFSLATNMPQIRDPYTTTLTQQQQQHLRSFDYVNAFSNFTQHIQPNLNGFTQHLNGHHHHQNLNWLGNDLGAQISSPPGFRSSNQNTKQQEC